MQNILLAVHLKRHTWDANAPFVPWLFAIARNKQIDALHRRGRRVFVNIDDLLESIPSQPAQESVAASEFGSSGRRLAGAAARCCAESTSIKDTAAKLAMSEGAVRVAMHRELVRLAKLRRE